MRKLLALTAAIAATLITATAQAAVLLIDDFNVPAGAEVVVKDTTPMNGITWQGAPDPLTTGLGAPNIATSRRIGVESTVNNSGATTGGISGQVGGSTGRLNFSLFTSDNGNGYVEWTIPAFAINVPASYTFSVIASALGTSSNLATNNLAQFSFNGLNDGNTANDFTTGTASIGAFSFNATGSPVNFSLSAAEALKLSGGGALTLKLSGGEGWNLQLDQLSITVPEPTSLALVGLALVGAGFAASRRKA